jgi:hypothetical protein
MKDDKLMAAAAQLLKEIRPERDLWPAISEKIAAAIDEPAAKRWAPLFAQAAAVVLLVGASSAVTYMTMKDAMSPTVIASTDMIFEQASFGNRYYLGPGFQDARNLLVADLEVELERLSPEVRKDIQANRMLIHNAIAQINLALEQEPENILLQERLLNTYREELTLLRRVSSLTRNVMLRNDI